MDPVVVEKVKFVTLKELPEFIDPSQLPESLGGTLPPNFRYIAPTPEENVKLTDAKGRLDAEVLFKDTTVEFEAETRKWCITKSNSSSRDEAAKKLRAAYAHLDPYIRARTIYHRLGVIREPNDVDWFRIPS